MYRLHLGTVLFALFLSLTAIVSAPVCHAAAPKVDKPQPGSKAGNYPTIGYVDAYPEPFTDSALKLSIGTQFPWYDRLGRFVTTIGGRFIVKGAKNKNGQQVAPRAIQVYFAGHPCHVTIPDPSTPTVLNSARWDYRDSSHEVGFGSGAAIYWYHVTYQWLNGTVLNDTSGNPASIAWPFTVCQISPATPAIDVVGDPQSGSSRCSFHPGANGSFTMNTVDMSSTNVARNLSVSFTATAPSGSNLDGLTVGIIQTLTETSIPGSLAFHLRPSSGPGPATATVNSSWTTPVPLWDGVNPPNNFPPYYWSVGVAGAPAGQSTWTLAAGTNLQMNDNPSTAGGPISAPGHGTYDFGHIAGSGVLDVGSNPRVLNFEDMLTANVSDLPKVFVPINGYKTWRTTYSGIFNASGGVSTGDGTTTTGLSTSNAPVADTSRGPVNSMETHAVTIP